MKMGKKRGTFTLSGGLWFIVYKTKVLALGQQSGCCSRVKFNGASCPDTGIDFPRIYRLNKLKPLLPLMKFNLLVAEKLLLLLQMEHLREKLLKER